jgi:pyruvate formate lyase activating enzyme
MDFRDVKGRIFDIQRFSVHDGPGIRTIVFLKGCMFRCRWCCNPEGQRYEIENLVMDGVSRTTGRDVTVGEIMDIVASDAPYYRRSGGGVTLSGGEALLQPEFAKAVFAECKKIGINTAIESTGAVDYECIQEVLPYVDYFLMDIKHMDSHKHKEFIGQGNEQVLSNAMKISQQARHYSVRVPVIPTFNDTEEEIEAIARFTSTLPKVDKLHLLPYHRLGQDKYKGLGRDYMLTEILPPDDGKMAMLMRAAKKHFENCVIGG